MPSPPPHPTFFQQNVRSSLSKLFPKKANLHAHLLLQFILTLRCKKKETCPNSDVNFLPSWVSTKEANSNVQNTFNIMRIFLLQIEAPLETYYTVRFTEYTHLIVCKVANWVLKVADAGKNEKRYTSWLRSLRYIKIARIDRSYYPSTSLLSNTGDNTIYY